MKISNEDYVARISSASALRLVIITYEIAIEHISDAIAYHEADKAKFKASVTHARDFLASLIDSLDLSLEIGRQLMAVYIHVNKILIDSAMKYDASQLPIARQMLENLMEGWLELEKDDKTPSVMKNTQQVYAGLTYGRNGLNEYITESSEHGFKA